MDISIGLRYPRDGAIQRMEISRDEDMQGWRYPGLDMSRGWIYPGDGDTHGMELWLYCQN